MQRLIELVNHYVLKRVDGTVSPAAFWSPAEPARVVDDATRAWYLDRRRKSPPYLLDYEAKLPYPLVNEDGVIVLNYGRPIGRQFNPEAASQYALGLHDRATLGRDRDAMDGFLRYAAYLLRHRDERGRWLYRFTWARSPDPWWSALAQGRGASVMLRAWRLTGDVRYREAALAACADFDRPVAEGGFQGRHPANGALYLEEYPFQPTAAINGALAAMLGLLELALWLDDEWARGLFEAYLEALDRILPLYTTGWWTLYDVDPESPIVNVHSPRYHRLVTDYLRILAAMTGRPAVVRHRDAWAEMDTLPARGGAASLKLVKKVLHR